MWEISRFRPCHQATNQRRLSIVAPQIDTTLLHTLHTLHTPSHVIHLLVDEWINIIDRITSVYLLLSSLTGFSNLVSFPFHCYFQYQSDK